MMTLEYFIIYIDKLLDKYIYICYNTYIDKENYIQHTRQHGGKNMELNSYMDILKFAIKLQMDGIEEEKARPFANEEFLDGVQRGLEIALNKIEASRFLAER